MKKDQIKTCLTWTLGLGLGLFLLWGRYDWSGENTSYALRSYLLSAFLFLSFLPVLYYFAKLTMGNSRWAASITAVFFLILTLPYHLLHLEKRFYFIHHTVMQDWRTPGLPLPSTNWFPEAFHTFPTIPHEVSFFLGFLVVELLLLFFLARRFRWKKQQILLALLVAALIPLQTWIHLSLRSPYTYIPHFEQPENHHYWYHYYLFPNAKGAVNLDYHAFRPAEELFMGVPRDFSPLLSRAFPTYLTAQFSAFFNSYYVGLLQNMVFWCLAVGAIYFLARRFFGEQQAFFASLLMASCQSVIVYAAQPKVYVTAICMLSLVVAFQQKIFSSSGKSAEKTFGFLLLFFLFLLCYEAQPWIVGLFLVAVVSGFDVKANLLSLIGGFLLYVAFLKLGAHLPHVSVAITLANIAGDPAENIKRLLLSGNVTKMAVQSFHSVRGFARCLVHAFQLCILPAAIGLFLLKGKTRNIVWALLSAPFLTYAYFEMGENWLYVQFPRLVMLAYPVIYLCAAYALSRLWEVKTRSGLSIGKLGTVLFLLINFVYLNLDAWGYPWIYYLWFYRNPGFSIRPY